MIISAYSINDGMEVFLKNPEDLKKLTIINYSFGTIKNGELNVSKLKFLNKIEEMRKINPDIKILLSIGGWGAGGFSTAASNSTNMNRFIDSVSKILKTYKQIDGIDVDWEYPCSSIAGIDSSPSDKHNFTLLLMKLRKMMDELSKIHRKKYLLTIAAGAGEYFTKNTEPTLFVKYIDYVNLMTYDMRGSFTKITGHHTNLYPQKGDPNGPSVEKAVEIFNECGIPLNKIVIGAAFYARVWKGVKDQNNGLNQAAKTFGNQSYSYSVLVEKFINKSGFRRYWDDNAKAPYLFNGDTFISYDDSESLREKVNYVKFQKLAGVMFWEYSLDKTHTLLENIYSSFRS